MLTCRAPVDRMTLQPGRRASKSGLESLRTNPKTKASDGAPAPPDKDDDAEKSASSQDDHEEEARSLSAI